MPSPTHYSLSWHIGCSGFHYKEWKEVFYPKGLAQKNWFHFYAQHFNTLELNVTFYRFPTLASLQSWYGKAPENFCFSAKVPRAITHYKKFEGTQSMLSDFYASLKEGLREKLGCVLFQLPPQITYSPEVLDKIAAQVNDDFQNVIEFRHISWWRRDVQQYLAKRNISFCGVSFPKIEEDGAVCNTSRCYYRFHGVPRLFYSEYSEDFLQRIYDEIRRNKKVKEAFIYFNNTASVAALKNAQSFQGFVL